MNREGKFENRFFAGAAILMFGLLIFISSCKKNSITSTTDTGTVNSGALVGGTSTVDNSSITSGTAEGSTEVGANADDLIANSTFSSVVAINFGTTVTITNPLAASGVTITQSGGDVTITSTATGVDFQLSGTTTNGSVKVYSDKKFKLTLNGVSITNNDGPALNIQSSKRFFLEVKDNTTNTLTDAATYATSTEDMKGTLFSEGQMIFVGNGTLNVKANYKHAIVSDDYIRVVAGNINVTGAVSDGIHANDAIIIDGGTVKITATGDGIQADEGHVIINSGTITTNTVDKGISATYEGTDVTIVPYVTINGGTITVTSTKGEGIESKGALTINNGTIAVSSYDDGINAKTAIYINGGSIYAYATNNDAMDSNGTFTITGGKIVAIGANSPEASIDCDARTLKITGGLLVGIAGATSGPTASVSTVRSVVMGAGLAQILHIEAADGTEVITFLAPKSFSTILVSGSKLKANTAYTVYTAGSMSADATNFHGLYLTGTYTRGYKGTVFTTTSVVTQTGGSISRN
jgi:hypothetical protein